MLCVGLLLACTAGAAGAVGERVNGFPNWAERVIHEWINRARVDPQVALSGCGANCVESACYSPKPPLTWSLALNRSARFHSDELVRQGYFAHDSACTLVSNINTLYPTACDGSASCACVGGVRSCSPTCTSWAQRVQLFGASPSGEIIASPSDPNQAFNLWLFERGDVSTCQFTSANGHRWLILTSSGAVGAGVAGESTGDFGGGTAPTKIPSAAHYPQQASSVEAWANWYDTAGPTQATVNVDGTCRAMTLQRGTQTNGAWSATLTGFGSGCHRYYFSFVDSLGATVTYPTTGSLAIGSGAACPDWDSARPAACAEGTVTPTPSASPTPMATATQTASRTATRTTTVTSTATSSPSATATAPPSGQDVSGYVRYYSNDAPVPRVSVHATAASATTSSATDSAGHYVLTDAPTGTVIVSPDGAGVAGGAVSALDAAYVLQSVAGLRPLSASQRLACDVTGNGSLSALDAALLLQYAVGLTTSFPVTTGCHSDWAFIPVPASAPNQALIQPQPGSDACTSGGIVYQPLTTSLDEQNFAALVFGDCTGNWQPPRSAGNAAIALRPARAGRLRSLRGGRLVLPIALDAPEPVYAFEARVTYDAGALRAVSVRPSGAARHAALAFNAGAAGEVRIAVAHRAAMPAGRRPVLLVMFEAAHRPPLAAPAVSVRFNDD